MRLSRCATIALVLFARPSSPFQAKPVLDERKRRRQQRREFEQELGVPQHSASAPLLPPIPQPPVKPKAQASK